MVTEQPAQLTHMKAQPLVDQVRGILDRNPEFRDMLFPFGFLLTDQEASPESADFPFYGAWTSTDVGRFRFWTHPGQNLHLHTGAGRTLFLVGHAYDPLKLIHDEAEILRGMEDGLIQGEIGYLEALNRLTGVFVTGLIDEAGLVVYGDAAGMQTCYYGEIDGAAFVTSHAALVGSIRSLQVTEYVRHLTSYRFYHLFGRALPGDLSPYDELRRLTPNHQAWWRGGGRVPCLSILAGRACLWHSNRGRI